MRACILYGYSGHIGSQLRKDLIDDDWFVIGISRNESPFSHPSYRHLAIDVQSTSTSDLYQSIAPLLRDHQFQGLICNASKMPCPDDYSESFSQQLFSQNCNGMLGIHLKLINLLLPIMGEDFSCVLISSMYGIVSPDTSVYDDNIPPIPVIYGILKSSIIQLARHLSSLHASSGIRFNAVSYGPFPTPIVQKHNPAFIRRLSSKTHLKRIGSLSDVSGPVLFLLSSSSSFVTGHNLVVDGGWTAS